MEKKKPNLEQRIDDFKHRVMTIASEIKYDSTMVIEFILYWTEYNEGGRKFRAEQQKIFNIRMRLATWKRNTDKFTQKPNDNNDLDALNGAYE